MSMSQRFLPMTETYKLVSTTSSSPQSYQQMSIRGFQVDPFPVPRNATTTVDFFQDPRDPIALSLPKGSTLKVFGVTTDGQWAAVETSSGQSGEVPCLIMVIEPGAAPPPAAAPKVVQQRPALVVEKEETEGHEVEQAFGGLLFMILLFLILSMIPPIVQYFQFSAPGLADQPGCAPLSKLSSANSPQSAIDTANGGVCNVVPHYFGPLVPLGIVVLLTLIGYTGYTSEASLEGVKKLLKKPAAKEKSKTKKDIEGGEEEDEEEQEEEDKGKANAGKAWAKGKAAVKGSAVGKGVQSILKKLSSVWALVCVIWLQTPFTFNEFHVKNVVINATADARGYILMNSKSDLATVQASILAHKVQCATFADWPGVIQNTFIMFGGFNLALFCLGALFVCLGEILKLETSDHYLFKNPFNLFGYKISLGVGSILPAKATAGHKNIQAAKMQGAYWPMILQGFGLFLWLPIFFVFSNQPDCVQYNEDMLGRQQWIKHLWKRLEHLPKGGDNELFVIQFCGIALASVVVVLAIVRLLIDFVGMNDTRVSNVLLSMMGASHAVFKDPIAIGARGKKMRALLSPTSGVGKARLLASVPPAPASMIAHCAAQGSGGFANIMLSVVGNIHQISWYLNIETTVVGYLKTVFTQRRQFGSTAKDLSLQAYLVISIVGFFIGAWVGYVLGDGGCDTWFWAFGFAVIFGVIAAFVAYYAPAAPSDESVEMYKNAMTEVAKNKKALRSEASGSLNVIFHHHCGKKKFRLATVCICFVLITIVLMLVAIAMLWTSPLAAQPITCPSNLTTSSVSTLAASISSSTQAPTILNLPPATLPPATTSGGGEVLFDHCLGQHYCQPCRIDWFSALVFVVVALCGVGFLIQTGQINDKSDGPQLLEEEDESDMDEEEEAENEDEAEEEGQEEEEAEEEEDDESEKRTGKKKMNRKKKENSGARTPLMNQKGQLEEAARDTIEEEALGFYGRALE